MKSQGKAFLFFEWSPIYFSENVGLEDSRVPGFGDSSEMLEQQSNLHKEKTLDPLNP
jgi:hypothetical protein